nr:PREDICTED: protein FAM227B isoform X2 [Lepisosteus oculatus]
MVSMEEPARNFQDFIRFQQLVDWPIMLEEKFNLTEQLSGYHSANEIAECLQKEAPFHKGIITELEQRVEELSCLLETHASKMLYSETPTEKTDVQPSDISPQILGLLKKARQKLRRKSAGVSPRIMNIKDCKYPGFTQNKYNDLPGQLDVLLLMDYISEAQNFNSGFLKVWKPFFLTDSSVAVLKDTFWWFYVHAFKPNPEDENKLFDRISENFVVLLMTVQPEVKDKLFKVYADCLAQAVYSAFHGAFPESHGHFDEDFKTELTDLISHWISGVKPVLYSWKKWNLNGLSEVLNGAGEVGKEPKILSVTSGTQCQMAFNLEELIKNKRKISVVQTVPFAAKRESGATTDVKTGVFARKWRESHSIGPNPESEHVPFMPGGQSPLVARYLQLHGIPHTVGGQHVKRTEIRKLPPLTPTYQDIIGETQRFRNKLQKDYIQLCEETEKDIAEIHQEERLHTLQINRMKRAIMCNATEIKIKSEMLIHKWEHAAFSGSRHHRKDERETEAEETKNADSDSEVSPGGGEE